MTEARIGSLAAVGAAILFGASNVATVFVLRSFTPVAGALHRSLLAGVLVAIALLVVAAGARRREGAGIPRGGGVGDPVARAPARRARLGRALVIGLCGGPLFLVGLNLAVEGTGPTVTAFVSGLYAVFAAALAPFVLAEPLRPRVVVGLACALAGCALLSGLQPDAGFATGLAAAFGAALIYGCYLVLGRRWSAPYGLGALHLTAATIATSIVGLGAWVILVDPAALTVTGPVPEAVGALLLMGVSLAVGQSLVVASIRRIQAARTAAFLLLNPITALVLAAILLDERLEPRQLAGAGLVLAGIGVAIGLDRLVRGAGRPVSGDGRP